MATAANGTHLTGMHSSMTTFLTIQVHAISPEGKTVHVVLDETDGILNPTRVRVDAGCERLAVINKGGQEIRMYNVQLYFTSDDDTSSSNQGTK